jgi:hypothetical protein
MMGESWGDIKKFFKVIEGWGGGGYESLVELFKVLRKLKFSIIGGVIVLEVLEKKIQFLAGRY